MTTTNALPAADEEIVTYDAHVDRGFGRHVWRQMNEHLLQSHELTWRLFLRSFRALYRQSSLGYFWALAPTVVTVTAFAYLNVSRTLVLDSQGLPYVLFALLGMSTWQLFAMGLAKCTQSLSSAGSFVVKVNFPRETLVMAAVLDSIVEFLIRSVLLVPAFAYYQFMPPWTILLAPLVLIPLLLWIAALGFLLAAANAVLRDFGSAIGMGLMFLMFVCPVFYSPPDVFPRSLMNWLNPASPFVIAFRDLATMGYLTHPYELLVLGLLSPLAFILCWRTFDLAMPRIIERI